EAQVFLDIHEVEDGPGGRWAKLNHELDGRGTPDPEAAIQDICLGELYYRFIELLKPQVVEGFHRFFAGTAAVAADDFITSLGEPVRSFIKTAAEFIGGADGRYDPFVREDREPALPPGRAADEWNAYLGRLLEISEYVGETKAVAESPAMRRLRALAVEIQDKPRIIAIALGYGLLSLLRPILGKGASGAEAARLGFDHWQLDRKLREQYRGLGFPEDEAWRITALMKAALSRTVPKNRSPYETGTPFKPGLLGVALIEEHYEAEDFRSLLGINFFEDITWFNKEGFEAALFYGSLFFMLESGAAFEEYAGGKKAIAAKGRKTKTGEAPKSPEKPAAVPWLERVEMICGLVEALSRAETASGYHLDGLLDGLAGKNGGKTNGKPAGVKKSSKTLEGKNKK
ncbi:MAG: alpha-amylase, partial [Treponema sp.]|nr:alpha-amylase [Treponema sp.]